MKKYFFIIVLTAFTQAFLFGQSESDTRRWHFGAMVGPQFMTFSPKQENFKGITGIMAGLDVGYRLQNSPKGWSAHLQPYFVGFRNTQEQGEQNTNYYIKLESKTRSISLPLLVRYTILGGKIRPFAELGTSWSINSSSTFKSSGRICIDGSGCSPVTGEEKINFTDDDRLGALVGAGVQVDIGKITIPIGVRVVQNIKKRETYTDPSTGENRTISRARGIQLTAGISF
ncbi:PorT family protein [Dyadobacter sp. CY261]|uniref:outer membrane beta-barrel protein n=1 Tax=Dyadobacter sp. CY261 TaxID=2907203 RepID=UPI001F33B775|nr:outer membrane beta-barrel protein [Dyadobacter sp. CY261]MCF0069430.1 PorT family protein [Dyadobacter sp. CY261]